MLSRGHYKSAIHRIVQPLRDQRGHKRLGVFYFCYANDDVPLEPLSASPVLSMSGYKATCGGGKSPSDRSLAEGLDRCVRYLKKSSEEGVEEEVLHGIHVKHDN